MKIIVNYLFFILVFIISCEPLVTRFDDTMKLDTYTSKTISSAPNRVDTLKFMTWNIRFGVGRTDWFGDCCGDRVIIPIGEVKTNLQKIADFINETQPDILFQIGRAHV